MTRGPAGQGYILLSPQMIMVFSSAVLRRGGGEGIAQWILGGGLMDYRMVSDGYTGRARVEVGRKLIFVDCFSQ